VYAILQVPNSKDFLIMVVRLAFKNIQKVSLLMDGTENKTDGIVLNTKNLTLKIKHYKLRFDTRFS